MHHTSDDYVHFNEALSPITLPCGRTIKNRFVKAATYEHLASYLGGPPNNDLLALYNVWGTGGWGMVITGNVQVCKKHLSLGADMVIPEIERAFSSSREIEEFRRLADAMRGLKSYVYSPETKERNERPLAIMQLNHTGRQSPRFIGGRIPLLHRPLSASSTRVGDNAGEGRKGVIERLSYYLLFERAKAMDEAEMKDVIDRFARGAQLAWKAGFDGVQVHAAHGYLIAQYISRKTNLRTDSYNAPLAFLHDIILAIRTTVPQQDFVVGIKLNSADYASGGFFTKSQDGKAHLAEVASWAFNGTGVDFVEISGGDYESPEFMAAPSTSSRQAFFEDFARIAVEAVQQPFSSSRIQEENSEHVDKARSPPLIMLTGGLRSRTQFSSVLANNHAHLLGIARLAMLQPHLPRLLLSSISSRTTSRSNDSSTSNAKPSPEYNLDFSWESLPPPEPKAPSWWPRIVGAGVGMAWHNVAMRRLARNKPLPFGANWVQILLEMYLGDLNMLVPWLMIMLTVLPFCLFHYWSTI